MSCVSPIELLYWTEDEMVGFEFVVDMGKLFKYSEVGRVDLIFSKEVFTVATYQIILLG
jgi:hypothetical protein